MQAYVTKQISNKTTPSHSMMLFFFFLYLPTEHFYLCLYRARVYLPQWVDLLQVLLIVIHLTNGHLVAVFVYVSGRRGREQINELSSCNAQQALYIAHSHTLFYVHIYMKFQKHDFGYIYIMLCRSRRVIGALIERSSNVL